MSAYSYLIGLSATPYSGMDDNKSNSFVIGMHFLQEVDMKQVEEKGEDEKKEKSVNLIKYNNPLQRLMVVSKNGMVSSCESTKLV